MRSRTLLVAAALSLVAGVVAPAPAWAAPPALSAPEVQPDPASPFAREVRAEAILGRIGLVVAHTTKKLEQAHVMRDVVTSLCQEDKLRRLAAIEAKAREKRSALRDAALDDAGASDAPWAELGKLEEEAKKIELESNQCRGEMTYASEVIMVTGSASSADVALHSLGRRVSSLGNTVFRSHERLAVSKGSALPGPPPASPIAAHVPQGVTGGGGAAPPVAAPAASPFKRDGAHDTSMLLRSAQLTLAVYEVDKKMDAVEAAAREVGGYLALRGDREISVRVPRERFDEALKTLEKLGDVLHKSVAAEDVTDQYVDLELRLKNAHAVRARLEKLLETATVRDAVEIQKELARVTEEIERLEGKLKLLRDRIAFSTITVTFERTEPQRVKTQQALLPFPWMRTMGLQPLLQVNR